MGMIQTISTFNAAVRTLLATAVVVGCGFVGWVGYQEYNKSDIAQKALSEAQDQIKALTIDIKAKDQEIDKLDTAMRLLKVDHRLARIRVLEVGQDKNGQRFSRVQFVEINDQGEPISESREFPPLLGDEIRVDGLVVKFKDEYVEGADLLRGTTLYSFRSLYGNDQGPKNGFPLDTVGKRPDAYGAGSEMSYFEKRIWEDFWEIAMDPDKQEELGIRAIHGQANYVKAVEGKTLYVELRASGGAGIRVTDEPPIHKKRDSA